MDKLRAAQAAMAEAEPKGKGGGGGRGKGKGKGKGGIEARIKAVESVLVQHERSIHMLEDRCTYVIMVREARIQNEFLKLRDVHRTKRRTKAIHMIWRDETRAAAGPRRRARLTRWAARGACY